jgi:Fe2+ or Zn2+ uptake regulation protein
MSKPAPLRNTDDVLLYSKTSEHFRIREINLSESTHMLYCEKCGKDVSSAFGSPDSRFLNKREYTNNKNHITRVSVYSHGSN